jgi:hypothetical protein
VGVPAAVGVGEKVGVGEGEAVGVVLLPQPAANAITSNMQAIPIAVSLCFLFIYSLQSRIVLKIIAKHFRNCTLFFPKPPLSDMLSGFKSQQRRIFTQIYRAEYYRQIP